MIRTIIFDFDGVILESVSIKTEAFRALFSEYPDHVEAIVRFHVENGGMSRYDKFRHIHTNILKINMSAEMMESLSARFSDLVFGGVAAAPFVRGAKEFLEGYSDQYDLFVVSATPESELQEIIRMKEIDNYFKGIYGSPKQKEGNIQIIQDRINNSPDSVVFIGDSRNDWKAAVSTGIRFIARVKTGDTDPFIGLPSIDAKVSDLQGLHAIIKGL